MRSVPAGSFARLASPLALWRAFVRCSAGKRRTPRVAAFDLDADREVLRLSRDLLAGRYQPGGYRLHVIRDPKVRLIAAAPVRDRVLQDALVRELAPTYEASFIEDSYASGTGRGPLRAALCYLSFQRRFRFRLSLDVRRYFPSIRHEILQALLFRRLRDGRTRDLLRQLIAAGGAVYQTPLAREVLGLEADPLPPGSGLAIGAYLSQWSGALYLDGLDHYVKRTLKIPGYLRYMDDLALFDDDPRRLAEARGAIAAWLLAERGLTLGQRRLAVVPTDSPAVFVGLRISRGGLAPGPKLRRRLRLRLRAAAARGHARLWRSLQSYRGLFMF